MVASHIGKGGGGGCEDCAQFRSGFLTHSGPMFGYRMAGRDADRRATVEEAAEALLSGAAGLLDDPAIPAPQPGLAPRRAPRSASRPRTGTPPP